VVRKKTDLRFGTSKRPISCPTSSLLASARINRHKKTGSNPSFVSLFLPFHESCPLSASKSCLVRPPTAPAIKPGGLPCTYHSSYPASHCERLARREGESADREQLVMRRPFSCLASAHLLLGVVAVRSTSPCSGGHSPALGWRVPPPPQPCPPAATCS
jgi:hypothetical protein